MPELLKNAGIYPHLAPDHYHYFEEGARRITGDEELARTPLFGYTHMPTHMRRTFEVGELQDIQLAEPFRFTKGCRTMTFAGRQFGGRRFSRRCCSITQPTPARSTPSRTPRSNNG